MNDSRSTDWVLLGLQLLTLYENPWHGIQGLLAFLPPQISPLVMLSWLESSVSTSPCPCTCCSPCPGCSSLPSSLTKCLLIMNSSLRSGALF